MIWSARPAKTHVGAVVDVMMCDRHPKISEISLVPSAYAKVGITLVVATHIYISIGTEHRKMIHLMTAFVSSGVGLVFVDPVRNACTSTGLFDPDLGV